MQGTTKSMLAGAAVLAVMAGATAASGTTGSSDARSGHGKPGHGHGHGHGHTKAVEKVNLYGTDGARVGRATLRQTHSGVLVTVATRGLTPGFHGLHVHAVGLCDADAPDGPFTTAGGHYTGGQPNHGDHAGDLPSLLVTDKGHAWSSFLTDRFTLRELRDSDGSALMVHQGRDNFANIPDRYAVDGVPGPDATTLGTGDAGTRAACGVID